VLPCGVPGDRVPVSRTLVPEMSFCLVTDHGRCRAVRRGSSSGYVLALVSAAAGALADPGSLCPEQMLSFSACRE